MFTLLRALACLALFLVLAAPLLVAQDGTLPASAGAFGIAYLLSNIVPEIAALVTKHYNTGQGWYAGLGNGAKMAVYVLGTMAVMTLFQVVGLAFDPNVDDIRSLGTPTLTNLIHSVFVTLMVKLGITSAKKKLGVITSPRYPRG